MAMKRRSFERSHCEQSKSSRHEDREKTSHSRTEDKKLKRRLEWKRQRELEAKHERKKQKMIMEYELKHLENLKHLRRRSRSRSKSRSPSPHKRWRSSTAVEQKKQPIVMSEKLDAASGNAPLFKGPEGTQISTSELRRIKVNIHRDIHATEATTELQRDIVNPEDVVLKRREYYPQNGDSYCRNCM